jgi:hypothetical protein
MYPSKLQQFTILNLDGEGIGTHWVGLQNIGNKNICYFDSYGAPPTDNIVNQIKKRHHNLITNDNQLQSFYSSTCGFFVIYVMDKLNAGNKFIDIIYSMKPNEPTYNEKKIKDYFT